MIVDKETLLQGETEWCMPLRAQNYDRSPLTTQEWGALEQSVLSAGDTVTRSRYRSKPFKDAQPLLSRLNQPYGDVFRLRHPTNTADVSSI